MSMHTLTGAKNMLNHNSLHTSVKELGSLCSRSFTISRHLNLHCLSIIPNKHQMYISPCTSRFLVQFPITLTHLLFNPQPKLYYYGREHIKSSYFYAIKMYDVILIGITFVSVITMFSSREKSNSSLCHKTIHCFSFFRFSSISCSTNLYIFDSTLRRVTQTCTYTQEVIYNYLNLNHYKSS